MVKEPSGFVFRSENGPMFRSGLRVETSAPGPIARSILPQRNAVDPAACARLSNGDIYVSKRKGVSQAACGPGFKVYFPDAKQLQILGCSDVPDWAGYICLSLANPELVATGCPLWADTLPCNLGVLEPCHPHPADTGCTEGLHAPQFDIVNETCTHSCPRGYELDVEESFEPVCAAAGAILPAPPCLKQCSQQVRTPEGASGFTVLCSKPPETERDTCEVVPSSWSRVCNTESITCEDDLRAVECKERTCPADPAGLGVHQEAAAGTSYIPRCPQGYHPTVDLVVCGTNGWSHSNICRPGRPPRVRISRSECTDGYLLHTTSILDEGFPRVNTGIVAGTIRIPCASPCCKNGLATSVSVPLGGCRCELASFGFTVDPEHPQSCCVPPRHWDKDYSRYSWKAVHEFVPFAAVTPCSPQPCTEEQCSKSEFGCMGFNGTHLFTRVQKPGGSGVLAGSVRNVVVLEYIFE